MSYAIYLRKSRADLEAEARNEGETLARHQAQLIELAKRQNLTIGKVYKELVSGDTISARPKMQELLNEVSEGMWQGILCMEIERLARGDTIDQGIVAQAFKFSNTKIITPIKTYDPNNEYDEEYFEFNLFMSRREYKTIKRRMQAGRLASVKEGNYIGSQPPYGYRKIKDEINKCFTLEPIKEETDIVKMIYDLFTEEKFGYNKIATYLTKMGVPAKRTSTWAASSIKSIISNPIYCGNVRWGFRPLKKKMTDGKVTYTRPRCDGQVFKGNHPAVISNEQWDNANNIAAARSHASNTFDSELKNKYVGLLYCGFCGHAMYRRPYDKNKSDHEAQLMCNVRGCKCKSSYEHIIDATIIDVLEKELLSVTEEVIIPENSVTQENSGKNILDVATAEMNKLTKQKEKLYTLLEQEIYTVDVFTERMGIIEKQIDDVKKIIASHMEVKTAPIPNAEKIELLKNFLDLFPKTDNATIANELLKTVISRITYIKTTGGRYQESDLQLHIKMKF